MLNHLRPALAFTVLLTLLCGLIYPLAITGIAQLALPAQANGSMVEKDGMIIGSALIGQTFSTDRYFWPRPSAAGAGYDGGASSGSNLGPTSAKLKERVAGDVKRLQAAGLASQIPADAATASASGLDPDISPQFALAQVIRIAKVRGIPQPQVVELVQENTATRLLGVIGEPRVNVLQLNLALDAIKP